MRVVAREPLSFSFSRSASSAGSEVGYAEVDVPGNEATVVVDVLVAWAETCSAGACEVVGTGPCWELAPKIEVAGSGLICPSGLVVGGGGGSVVAGVDGDDGDI